MDRLHVHFGALILGLILGASPGCGDRTADDPDHVPSERACARAISHGHWADGRLRGIGETRHVCMCMTEEEWESRSRLDELNQLLLEDCEHDALQYEFDWTDCEDDFENKTWIGEDGDRVTWPTEPVMFPPGANLECD